MHYYIKYRQTQCNGTSKHKFDIDIDINID